LIENERLIVLPLYEDKQKQKTLKEQSKKFGYYPTHPQEWD